MGKAIGDLRSLSHSLDADHIRNNGWTVAVQKLLNDLQKTGKYKTLVHIEEQLQPLGSDKPIILFRMIQEAINNIIRHAAANTIYLAASKEKDTIVIKIKDNGKGFESGKNSSGVGLKNLKSRSKMINASLDIQSQPGEGTEVTIAIKAENNE
ncbi:MAG: hypothetical protein HC848_05885, partial [Limnobacter sp.]|nr:hypothetical protein [Limnobacter sp.]